MMNPLAKATELDVTAQDEARIVETDAFGSYGEPVRRIRDQGGAITALQIAGTTLVSETSLSAEIKKRYNVA